MENKKQVDGLRLLAWHKHVDLKFCDESLRAEYRSDVAPYIKGKVRDKI